MSLHVWIPFVATFGPAVAFPGANAAFTVATALEQGAPRCLLAPVGFGLATALHAMLAIVGASAILAASIELFEVLKWTAIVYLLWICSGSACATGGAGPR